MNQEMVLTPAQIDFLKSAIEDFSPETWKLELAGRAGSTRYFVRISKGVKSYVLVVWDSRDEDWDRFLSVQKDLQSRVSYLPEIFKSDALHGLILEEDLGNMTLKAYCNEYSTNMPMIARAYKDVLNALWKWQQLDVSVSQSISSRAMDLDTFIWETDYFARFCVTDYCACEKLLNKKWEKERVLLASEASSLPRTCIHRDFQSENVMIHNGEIRFVDYQGARLGPAEYDIASLLFDPYVTLLTPGFVDSLFSHYQEISGKNDNNRIFYLCAAQRLMQALGAYGNLSLHKGKEWYKEYIPPALERLVKVMQFLPEFKQITLVVEQCRNTLMHIDVEKSVIGT
jgi:N-acetylmuramate 1-kinase